MTHRTQAKNVLLLFTYFLTACASPSNPRKTSLSNPLREHNQASLQAAFDAAVRSTHASGGVAIVKTPQGRFELVSGVREIGQLSPPKVADHFRVGSVTKTMVAAIIMQLAQEGKIKLEDPVSKYRADVPNGNKISILQLLTMRSGLFNYTEQSEISKSLDDEPSKVWQAEQLLALAFQNPPRFTPGAEFHYSNTNTVLLGTIAEHIEKKSLKQILEDRLFVPLSLKETSFPESTNHRIPNPHPQAYMYGTHGMLLNDTELPDHLKRQLDEGQLAPTNVTNDNPSWAWAAGAAISTAEDMTTWVEALVNGSVLNSEYQKKWFDSAQALDPADPTKGYGIGHFSFATTAGSKLYGHFGLIPGFNTWAFHDPIHKVSIVAWANLCPNKDVGAFFGALVREIYQEK